MVNIIEGHIKQVLNSNEELYKERMKICLACPLLLKGVLTRCNPKMWINEDNEISYVEKKGYVKGCGCNLKAKTRLVESTCPITKW